jgi:hypothetical protein
MCLAFGFKGSKSMKNEEAVFFMDLETVTHSLETSGTTNPSK